MSVHLLTEYFHEVCCAVEMVECKMCQPSVVQRRGDMNSERRKGREFTLGFEQRIWAIT